MNPITFFKLAKAAPLLSARCNQLEERNELLEIHLALAKGRLAEAEHKLALARKALALVQHDLLMAKRSQASEQAIARAWLERCADVAPRRN